MDNKPIEQVTREGLTRYTHYVTRSRVLPHLDLKPVHRRIIWSLIKLGARDGKGKFIKSSTVVGTTLRYHPHGDASVSNALSHLVNTPNPLVSGRGNWGSIYGDGSAADRYTECKTSPIFEELIDESMFDIGDFIPSYDETDVEPILFQTKLPLVPLIGINGIGVGLVTSYPAFSFETIKAMVKANLTQEVLFMTKYAYGGVQVGNTVYPETSIVTREGKQYLHITQLPIGSSISIISESKLIQELLSNKIIEIIDESTHKQTSIYIHAPESIQNQILGSCSKSTTQNLYYYWNRLRQSNYIEQWIKERTRYIKKREYWKQSKLLLDHWTKKTLHQLSIQDTKINPKIVSAVSSQFYDQMLSWTVEGMNEFLPKRDNFISSIQSKPISAIREYDTEYNNRKEVTDEECKNILLSEIDKINPDLFSKSSVLASEITKSKWSGSIKRFINFKDSSIEVRFARTPRQMNWETTGKVSVVYSNGKVEHLSDYFFGVPESTPEKKVVGFITPYSKLVVITESIKSCYPAVKISVDDKEIIVSKDKVIDQYSSLKVLEV